MSRGAPGARRPTLRGLECVREGRPLKRERRPQAPVPATRVHARCTPATRGGARGHPAQSHARRGDQARPSAPHLRRPSDSRTALGKKKKDTCTLCFQQFGHDLRYANDAPFPCSVIIPRSWVEQFVVCAAGWPETKLNQPEFSCREVLTDN